MKLLFACGGTAGHINPALAVANYITARYPDTEVLFIGSPKGMEARLVAEAGYSFAPVEIKGIQRRLSWHNVKYNLSALELLATCWGKIRRVFRAFEPDVVIGTGGYVSGPVVLSAAKMGIRTAIHEQNAFPGVTNKILAKQVDLVFAAMPDAVEKLAVPHKTIVTGNPVRPEILRADREKARAKLGIRPDQLCLLSFGGSLGARTINQVIAQLAEWQIKNGKDFFQIHATGSYGVELFHKLCEEKGILGDPHLMVREYIDDMAGCLAAADLVISRSGAITISELAAAGRASILIPSPNVAENHQYYNALELSRPGAAILIEEKDLTGDKLIRTVDELTRNPDTLKQMGVAAFGCAHLNSLEKIYAHLEKLMQKEPQRP